MTAPAPGDAVRDQWNLRYRADHYVFGTSPNDFLRDRARDIAPGRALCLAEGEGRNAVFLAESGFAVTSIDLSEVGVDKTRALAAARGVEVHAIVGDLADHDLGTERWDLVVSVFAHLPPPVRRDLHQRVVRSLAPGGVFVLEAYTPDQIGRGTGGPPLPELTMTLAGLEDELHGLVLDHGVETERDVIEGAGHTGRAAVVQVVAHKPH